MLMLAAAAAVAFLVGRDARWAAAFLVGAGLGVLNYFWLHQAVETLMAAGKARVPLPVVAKVMLRYPLAFGLVYLFYRTGWLPLPALLAGLFVPVGGVLIEAVLQIADGLRPSGA